jgi:Holliday junction resolvase-like predicted endonuclease
MPPHKGKWAEDAALYFYKAHGYRLIGRNIRAFGGEIDLAFVKGKQVVLVEVKQRKNSLEDALLAVSPRKKERILRTWYQRAGKYYRFPVELHVCAVIGDKENFSISVFKEEL